MEKYTICINKNFLNFSAGHFVIFENNHFELSHPCETLHGHNYRVGIAITGLIDNKNGYILDFGIIKSLMKELLNHLDHLVLVPTSNPLIKINKQNDQLVVEFRKKKYVFPLTGVALLPIPNTTAEMLAKYFLDRIREELKKNQIGNLQAIEVEVEENFGQSAKCFAEINI